MYKKIVFLFFFLILLVPQGAIASGEVAEAELQVTPRGDAFYNNAFVPANWRFRASISAPNPPNTSLLPTRRITMRLPDSGSLRFLPSLDVCPDNMVGPSPTNISVPVPTIVARCPRAVIGNGQARFLLARTNNPDVELVGQVVLFNGGLRNGNPLIKFYAFSYDTSAGIYTESVLLPSGEMSVEFPVLSYDSAVNFLDISIPSTNKKIDLEAQGFSITLPGGKTPGFVQARCQSGEFPFSADFLLGRRLQDGTPIDTPVEINNIGSPEPCSGGVARPKLERPQILGTSTPRKKEVYRVRIQNSGYAALQGVRVRALGARGSLTVGQVAGRSTRTIRLPVSFRKSGRVRFGVEVQSSNGGSAKVFRVVSVR